MSPEIILSLCCALSQGFALFRIATLRVARTYPWLTAYLLAEISHFVLLSPFPYRSKEYFIGYTLTMCVLMPLRFGIAFEAWKLAMTSYPRIGSAARAIAWWCLGMGLVLAAMFGIDGFQFTDVAWSLAARMVLSLAIRYSGVILFVLCAALWTITSWIDHGVRPNVRRHAAVLTGYFLLIAVEFYAIHRLPTHIEMIGLIGAGGTAALWFVWAATLNPAGERAVCRDLSVDTSLLDRLPEIANAVLRS